MSIAGVRVTDTDFDFGSPYKIGVWTDVDKLVIQIREQKRFHPDDQLHIYKNRKDAYGLFSSRRQPPRLKIPAVRWEWGD